MKTLAGRIRRQLWLEANKFGHCGVYEKELQRVWRRKSKTLFKAGHGDCHGIDGSPIMLLLDPAT
jgi:hypothetical protein